MLAVDDKRPGPRLPRHMNLARHVLYSGDAADDKSALIVLDESKVETWTYGALRDRVTPSVSSKMRQALFSGCCSVSPSELT